MLASIALASAGAAQETPVRPTRQPALVVVHTYAARLDPGAGAPGLPRPMSRSFVVDSITLESGARRVRTSQFSFVVDSGGNARGYEAVPLTRPSAMDSATARRLEQGRSIAELMRVAFPETGAVPVFRELRVEPRPGAFWTEPIDWRIERLGVTASETGTRTTRITGDTLVDGVRHWILRDSSVIERVESWPEHAFTLAEDVAREQRWTGHRTGYALYDPLRALAVRTADTTHLEGVITRRFADGRTWTAPQTMLVAEARETMSSERHARWRTAQREPFRIMPVANTPLETRLAAADTVVLDSLVGAWRTVAVVDRDAIEQLLARWWRGDRGWRGRLMQAAAESGDSARAFRHATELLRFGSFDSAALAFVLPPMEDPGHSLRWGLGPDAGFDVIYYALLNNPDLLEPASAPCRPATTCAAIAGYATREDVDPRLRDLGVAVGFLLDPRGRYTQLDERARSGTLVAETFQRLANGYRHESSAPSTGMPFPIAGTDWREWRAWLAGRGGRIEPIGRAVFALFTRRTGRDFAREFRDHYETATEDSARLVFGALRETVERGSFGVGEIERLLDSGSPPLADLARLVVIGPLVQAQPAPDSVAAELIDAVLAAMIDSVPLPWSDQPARQPRLRAGPSTVLIADSLPAGVVARWGARIPIRTMAEWRAQDPREPGEATSIVVRATGNLALIRLSTSGRLRAPPEEPPYFWASGTTFVLLRTPSGWRFITSSSFIT